MNTHHRKLSPTVKSRVAGMLFAGVLGGCATTPAPPDEANDPYEQGFNRPVYAFNDALDRNVVKPVADKYVEHTPAPVRGAVTNFLNNLSYPGTVLNSFLQGKVAQGASDAGRFVVNSTLGWGGVLDPASPMGLKRHDEDFGQTLATWGVAEGPYLVLPFLGPSGGRDAPGIPVSAVTNVLFYVSAPAVTIPLGLVGAIDKRAQASTALKVRDETALDPYVFVREGYRQHRTAQIHDGDPPLDDFEEFDALAELDARSDP